MTKKHIFDTILSSCVTVENGKSLISFFDSSGKSYSVAIIQIFSVGKMILRCRETRIHFILGSTTTERGGALKDVELQEKKKTYSKADLEEHKNKRFLRVKSQMNAVCRPKVQQSSSSRKKTFDMHPYII